MKIRNVVTLSTLLFVVNVPPSPTPSCTRLVEDLTPDLLLPLLLLRRILIHTIHSTCNKIKSLAFLFLPIMFCN